MIGRGREEGRDENIGRGGRWGRRGMEEKRREDLGEEEEEGKIDQNKRRV